MIARVLAMILGQAAVPGSMEQRRAAQVIRAVEDVAGREVEPGTIAGKRVDEAHDIIHRIAAILAMESEEDGAVPEMAYDAGDTRERISIEDNEGAALTTM